MRPALLVALAALLLCPAGAGAQIVNTLSGFREREPGWSGEAQGRFSLTGGNTEVVSLSGALRLQWQQGSHRIRALASARWKSAGGERIGESSTAHLRYNRRLVSVLSSLVFVQHQRNPFQRLRTRILFGAGGRVDLVDRERARLAVGAAHMIELEEEADDTELDTDHRLSTFVSFHGGLGDRATADLTAFVQPRWSAFGDLRAVGTGALRVVLVGRLALLTTLDAQYDAEPPARVETTDWEVETGLSYAF